MLEAHVLMADPELTVSQLSELTIFISPERRERLGRYRFFRDAQNALLGELLARTRICELTGLKNSELVFSAGRNGKPFLISDLSLHFNISHTSGCIACAVSDSPVGIDIENLRPVDFKVAKRFFTPDEYSYVSGADENAKTRRFFEVWTKKESRLKLEGTGFTKALSSFSVLEDGNASGVFYHPVYDSPETMCHLCTSQIYGPAVSVIDTRQLLSRFALISG